jgi:D-glycero-D-manno-heptose 1,7-bisphosphate phosphatase
MKGAVFLDRDDTRNEEVGYFNHMDCFRIFPGSAPAVDRPNLAGIPSVLITNQSGVAGGYFPESLVRETHAWLLAEWLSGQKVDKTW